MTFWAVTTIEVLPRQLKPACLYLLHLSNLLLSIHFPSVHLLLTVQSSNTMAETTAVGSGSASSPPSPVRSSPLETEPLEILPLSTVLMAAPSTSPPPCAADT
ncbi:hypothetical protein M0R45_027177 [Rubus argutus]|uniref:Uncharacterized protein n=1 Tax=Rubus argutus TaxID=59490 RepID=A0AAW1X359_RUBAR